MKYTQKTTAIWTKIRRPLKNKLNASNVAFRWNMFGADPSGAYTYNEETVSISEYHLPTKLQFTCLTDNKRLEEMKKMLYYKAFDYGLQSSKKNPPWKE